uniref:Uncharacterized protein n=1 Tax=Mycobacterium sp. CH-2 TaxID=332621 RepID=Q3Y539_9MYCO|nr:hypothetical protein [Mycobacterium sp. CH-2]
MPARKRPSRTSSRSSLWTKSIPATESGWRSPVPALGSVFSSTHWNLRVCRGKPRRAFLGFFKTPTVPAIEVAPERSSGSFLVHPFTDGRQDVCKTTAGASAWDRLSHVGEGRT